MIALTKPQSEIMAEFYQLSKIKVIYDKKQRQELWNNVTQGKKINNDEIKKQCPALFHQIQRSIAAKQNIQSAVFSECVYAQTYANLLQLNVFKNCYLGFRLPKNIEQLLQSYYLTARYVYTNANQSKMLIQAGGCNGVDSALIIMDKLKIKWITYIEYKEPYAKVSEIDLPEYDENGNMVIDCDFLSRHPKFSLMLKEHKNLNFFNLIGHNENHFSEESIMFAISKNYNTYHTNDSNEKDADVLCTEDKDGYLTMLPINQIAQWAEIEGEIRSAGRNDYKVWTANALKKFLHDKNAIINGNTVIIDKKYLETRNQRGNKAQISGYKINPLFFIRLKDTIENGGNRIQFNLNSVRQLKPTITAKVNFKNLQYDNVKQHYSL